MNPDSTPALESSTIITDDGFSIALYRYPAPNAKRRVLLVHGATYSGPAIWDFRPGGNTDASVMALLADAGVEPWTIDIRGYGRSQKPADGLTANCEAAQHDILAAVSTLGPATAAGDDLVLCGYSWGGYTSARFAIENPSLVGRLVLVAPGIWITPGPRPATTSLRAGSHNYGRNTRERLLERARLGPDDDIAIFDAFAEQALAHNPSSPLGIHTDYMNRAPGPMIDLAKLTMPVDIIFGADDPLGGPWVHDLFRALPSPDKSLSFVPNTGHWWPVQATRRRFAGAVAAACLQ